MWCRGIRGAITVLENTKEDIVTATKELLQKMLEANGVVIDDITCIWFTTTSDLNAEFPAVASRELGCVNTALICCHEMNVPGSLPKCVRILILVNTEKRADEIIHVYLKEAKCLREGIDSNQSDGTIE